MRPARGAAVGLVLVAALGASGCSGDASPDARATATVTVTASQAATTSLSLRRVCDDFEWFPNPPSSDAVAPWSSIEEALSVVYTYSDATAQAALTPLRSAATVAVVSNAGPANQRAYDRYKSAYDGFVAKCRAAGSTALS